MSEHREHYDELEVRTSSARHLDEARKLVRAVADAKTNAPYYRDILSNVEPAGIASRTALSQLPVTRKSDLKDIQALHRPFGGLNGWDFGRLAHIYQSPGPVYEPDGDVVDYWRFARSLWAAGVRPGMIVHNTFSYHLTPAGMIIESGARYRLPRDSRWHRQHRTAGAGDRRSASGGVLRHAVVSAGST